MKVPLSWLKEYVDIDVSADELAAMLTFSGTEVAGVQKYAHGLDGVIAGKIASVTQHPGADKLKICMVNDGNADVKVVCGADNYKPGDVAAFAPCGTVLPGGMKIKQAKLRGEDSFGMLCAEDELGLSDDHDGIMLLPADTKPGTKISDVIGEPDSILHIEVTWNRPDCLSVVGIAREIAALTGRKLKMPSFDLVEAGEDIAKLAKVTVTDSTGCPRYTARVIDNVRIMPSPARMQRRLKMSGIRAINNIVDITNYILLELGQPLHAFDYNLLNVPHVIVRRAGGGEKMKTLDGVERSLTSERLAIADEARPIALAGVMGGEGSEIQSNTSRILLESAAFNQPMIRSTSVKLGLSTESSHRFERGVDVTMVEMASRRAALLMAQHAGATVARSVIDFFPSQYSRKSVKLRYGAVNDMLGTFVAQSKVNDILDSLGLERSATSQESCTVRVPGFRLDIDIEADLIEEIARIYGLDKIPAAVPYSAIVPAADDSKVRAEQKLRSLISALGVHEIMNYSFLSEGLLDSCGTDNKPMRLVLPNPVSADHSVMRDSLIPQMMETLGRNLSRQINAASFYEIGHVYSKAGADFSEEARICIGLMGKIARQPLDMVRPVESSEVFQWLKGLIEQICTAMRLGAPVLRLSDKNSFFGEGAGVNVELDGVQIGVMGIVRESIRKKWRMSDPVAVAELKLDPLLASAFKQVQFSSIPVYPAVSRDVAMLVDEAVSHSDVLAVIRKNAPQELTSIDLFDIFKGKGIADGKKSVAYSLVYRSSAKTLKDEEANKLHESIKDALRKELKVEIR